ncbi:xanthine dehydrogenase molybdopterin binding subunit [Alteromonas mediterranea]|uniref:xanthine dehydrogenase molybdopterin binding subunit n=1 Tax=Alteromonas mediterranea TaxID=314275 RepID=UPI0009031672|nr:xanthine dehydrogenase molybdopterin binding subunit [Alteromonas mediterranea]APD93752.1 xanthine dehydrogenase molybdopterin binding subunit [Alteromonas mediterranea]APD97377.1 xanthine dehydrogenase molybdopterin binding subunit [Alteromonas mediterranea]
MRKLIDTPIPTGEREKQGAVHVSKKHESAERQVQGTANYVDDVIEPQGTLYAAVGLSKCAKGTIAHVDLSAVRASEGVVDVVTIDDVPGHKDIGPVFEGDPLLANGEVKFFGQPVFAVLATSVTLARQAALKGHIEVAEAPPVLNADEAHAQQTFVRPLHRFGQQSTRVGDTFDNAQHKASGTLSIGGQEHMYLEGQVSLAIPDEEDRMKIYTSSQHPSEVQKLVAEVLDIKLHRVMVDMRRMGGGFGGKETQAAQWACIAALLASRNRCAVKLRLPRFTDMHVTGKRHPFDNTFDVAFDSTGKIEATRMTINGICGHSPDLSDAIVDRAMFHADNGYFLGDSDIVGHRLQTNMVSHTAYRGFGGPQGMIMAEALIDKIARTIGSDPLSVRKRNLYGPTTGTTTPYGMEVEHNLLPEMINELEQSAQYWQRREAISAFNRESPVIKKGLALTPVKFGISFTSKHLNQAGALVHIYTDGSIQINHGGTEMGQGLHTKIGQIAANEFGIDLDMIEVTATRTDKVPNTSPTAASSGTDMNGKAVQNACITLKTRLAKCYAESLGLGERVDEVVFTDQHVVLGKHSITFPELVQQAYFARVSLSSTGFYKTPKLQYNRDTGEGRPFFYFAYGVSMSEVSIDTLTGEYTVDEVNVIHDVGSSLNPAIDIGQIEGAFIQGMGWLTTEDLKWNESGKLISENMATYKIPAIGDTPKVFNVKLFGRKNAEDSIYHSKAVGEPPFMLAISVWCAIKDAISSLSGYTLDPQLDTPATPERVLNAIAAIQNCASEGSSI